MRANGPRSNAAMNNPVTSNFSTAVSEMETGSGPSRTMRSEGDAKDSLDKNTLIHVAEQPYDDEKMAMLAFMNELIEVRIATTTDKNAEQCFEINVNGKLCFFRRGETKTVPRYIVDHMMRMKQTVYSQREVLNAEGVREMVYDPQTAVKYDFSITRDPNPLSNSWQRAVMMEPG